MTRFLALFMAVCAGIACVLTLLLATLACRGDLLALVALPLAVVGAGLTTFGAREVLREEFHARRRP